jgi:hypothetical protein
MTLALVVYGARETKAATVTNAAVVALADFAFTAPHAANARRATITAGAVAINITWSGTNPAAALGHYIAAYGTMVIDGKANVGNLKMISTAGNSVVSVTLEY